MITILIKEIPQEERPRERLLKVGVEHLTNEELLSILLKTGSKNFSVKELSLSLLQQLGSLTLLKNQNIASLTKIKGLGPVKAMELLVTVELGKRIFLETENCFQKMKTPADIFKNVRYLFQDKKQELFYCLYFNTKQELVERKLLFMGTINRSIVHPREVFKEAYLCSASSIVCVHNHPSNDLIPSREDIRLTKALIQIGELNGIPVVDHIIVGDQKYYSFHEHGQMHR